MVRLVPSLHFRRGRRLLGACRSQEAERPAREWDRFVSGFIETYFEANPLFRCLPGPA